MRANPIKFSLQENDIKQLSKEDINIIKNAKGYKKTKNNIKLQPGDIIRFGRGSYHQVSKKLLEWFGNERTNRNKLNKLT